MHKTVYALLVGIDAYRSPVPPLRGCVRDIRSVEAVLHARTAKPGVDFKPLILLDEAATRQAIIDGFLQHLALAGPDDVALFYYAGHGSQERTPPEFWHLEPDRLDETLVCIDSREPGKYDLADKELAKLLAEVARRGAHTVVVLDSCHSGSGTRDATMTGVRRAPADPRERPLNTLLVSSGEAATVLPRASESNAHQGMAMLPKGRHVLMAACQDNEEAREIVVNGQTRGVFSHVLLEAIEQATGVPTYRDLMKRVNALVRLQVSGQYPLIETTNREDLDRPFLGGNVVEHDAYFTVTFDRAEGWLIDAGALHGVPQPTAGETTRLALFAASATRFEDLSQSVGEAEVTSTLPSRSKLQIRLADRSEPSTSMAFKAVVTALPLPPLTFTLAGDPFGVTQVRAALQGPDSDAPTSILVREVATGSELSVRCENGAIRIARFDDSKPLCADVAGYSESTGRKVVARLEHMARWRRIATLTNPATKLRPDVVKMFVYPVGHDGVTREDVGFDAARTPQLRFDYQFVNGTWVPASFKIKLVNTSERRLFCILLAMSQAYGITPDLLPGGGLWLGGAEEAWAFDGQPITAWVPDDLWKGGLAEINDVLKLIVSTEQSDATLLAQDDLDAEYRGGTTTRASGLSNTLERVLGRVQTRALGAGPGSIGKVADWRTAELSVLTHRPLEGVALDVGAAISVTPSVQVQGHSKLHAIARLVSLPAASRSASMPPLPALLIDDPARMQPLELAPSRGGDASLSVLELEVDTADAHLAVSPAEPLFVDIQTDLFENERVLPIGFDGEFYLPLGRATRTADGIQVKLDRLPKAVSTRSLTSAIRILFEKVVTEALGKTSRYPLLSAVDRSGIRTDKPETIRVRVSAATRILLYVHGIIGDTLGMAASAFVPLEGNDGVASSIADRYDLVLAFDYENLKTPIEQTARDLKKRLQAVGLGPEHGKEFHIVAHSMGGLVARWFIEREGGNAVVDRLVMLGTPNAGSPWATIEEWATTAIALGLNGLTAIAWPAKLFAGMVAAIEYVDVALDQMKADSPFLQTLSASEDPGIPYTILAGNTSVIAQAGAGEADRARLISRLFDRLSPQRVLHSVAGLAFFGSPNDIAVSVTSIAAVPPGRKDRVVFSEVPSDHISYFSTPAVLKLLNEQLTG